MDFQQTKSKILNFLSNHCKNKFISAQKMCATIIDDPLVTIPVILFLVIISSVYFIKLPLDLRDAFNTFVGTFFGAWFILYLTEQKNKKQESKNSLQNLLKTQYALLCELRTILQLYDFINEEKDSILNGELQYRPKLVYPANISVETKLAIEINPFEEGQLVTDINLNELTFLLEKSQKLLSCIFLAESGYQSLIKLSQKRNKILYEIGKLIRQDPLDLLLGPQRMNYSTLEAQASSGIGYLKSHTLQLFKASKNYLEDVSETIFKLDEFIMKEFNPYNTLEIKIDEQYRKYLPQKLRNWNKVKYYKTDE